MKQILQNIKTGKTIVADVPLPQHNTNTALVQTAYSLVSAGTERMLVSFSKQGLAGKARSRPDLVREVLNKAKREGLLSTIEAAKNKLDQLMALGYSSSGIILEVGSGLAGFKAGDRVACGGGGYAVHAEYASVPKNLLVPVPDTVDLEQAAFATVGAIAIQGFRLADLQVGSKVGVIGLGLLGLLTVGIAKAAGCGVLGVDLDLNRVDLALKMGANQAVIREEAAEAVAAFTLGRGLDAVLICADTSDNDPVLLAGEIARDRAHVVAVGAVGMDIPRKTYYEKELSLTVSRSYGPGRYDPNYEEKGQDYPLGYVRWTEARNMESFLGLLSEKKLDLSPIITHRFPIEEGERAYELITGKDPYLGVLISYPGEALPVQKRVLNLATKTAKINTDEMLAVGVLGAGNFALSTFLPAIKKAGGVAPIGIVSASGVSAAYAARRFGFGFSASDPQTLLDDPAINIIAILTRHNLHAEFILKALNAGKHVYCEKPLAINTEQLNEISQVLKVEGKPLLALGFNRRFAPLATQLKVFIDRRHEPLFAHYRVNANRLPAEHWLVDPMVGGGRIIGEGCHFIDFLTFLVGENPVEVTAQKLPDGGVYSEDNVIITFRYPDGSLGVVSYLANGDKSFSKEYLEIFSGGRIGVLNDWRKLELVHRNKNKVSRNFLKQDKGHKQSWEAFLHAITNNGFPPIPYMQLIGTTQASFAALESLRSGKPVSISFD